MFYYQRYMEKLSLLDAENGAVNLTGSGVISLTDPNEPGFPQGKGTLGLGANGTHNLGWGGAAGTLQAVAVNGAPGSATVNFNHTGYYSFAPK